MLTNKVFNTDSSRHWYFYYTTKNKLCQMFSLKNQKEKFQILYKVNKPNHLNQSQ